MHVRKAASAGLVWLSVLIGALALGGAPASALKTHLFSTSFGSEGSGAEQMNFPSGVAINAVTHDVYVVDTENYRVDEFSSTGAFILAWGWGVADGVSETPQTCTLVCFKGIRESEPGAFFNPQSIAVDNSAGPSAGDVYVSSGDNLVQKFTAAGALVNSWSVRGQLDGSTAPNGPFRGVAGIAVAATGSLLVADQGGKLFEFAQDGTFVKELNIPGVTRTNGLAIDPEGDIFKTNENEGTAEYTSSGSYVGQLTSSPDHGLAIDSATGNLYVSTGSAVADYSFSKKGVVSEHGGSTCVVEPGAGCPATDTFGSGILGFGRGVAVDPSNHDVYVADATASKVDVFTPATLAEAATEPATGVSESTATLHGTLNADETTVTGCEFEYGTTKGVYDQTASCGQSLPLTGNSPVPVSASLSNLTQFATYYYRLAVTNSEGTRYGAEESFTLPGPPRIDAASAEVDATEKAGQTNATLKATIDPDDRETTYRFEYGETTSYGTSIPIPAAAIGSGVEPVPVTAELSGLKVGTAYHYRVVANNEYGQAESADQQFTTTAAALVEDFASEVAATSATLGAQIDPLGRSTVCNFQYVTEADFAASGYAGATSVPCPNALGEGEGDVSTSVQLQGLAPSTTYHYRVVTENAAGTTDGPDGTFTTQGAVAASALPDGRQWELVSPAQKYGAQVFPVHDNLIEAAEDGAAITYYTTRPLTSEPAGNAVLSQALSERGPNGWVSEDIAPPHALPTITNPDSEAEYDLFSPGLTLGLFAPNPSAGAEIEKNLYLRNSATGETEALLTSANTLAAADLFGDETETEFVTATPDMSHVILIASQKLTAQGDDNPNYIYEWSAGQLRRIAETGEGGGHEAFIGADRDLTSIQNNERNALSDDGSRIFWGNFTGNNEVPLYMEEPVASKVVKIDAAQGVSEPVGNRSEFQVASADGSKAFFTDAQQLTSVAGGGLYVYEVETGELRLLTVAERAGEAKGDQGGVEGEVLGASEDGSYLYVVTNDILHGSNQNDDGERAATGGDNLYVLSSTAHAGATDWTASFIADLGEDDRPDWGESLTGAAGGIDLLAARVSPNGQHLAFMSDKSLTGYDNVDVSSGQRDEEVYSYDAASGRLVCASCNPTGAQPAGYLGQGGYSPPDPNEVWSGRWVAASVPEWVGFNNKRTAYQPRYLLDSGRLFFNTSDALASQDTDGTEDVYEYEPEGVGDCTSASLTYSGKAGGCIGLISGGRGEQESVFADASASGDDAFFVTSDRLVGSDVDTAYDMYDAHVCSARAPCPSAGESVPPACDTVDSCRAAPTPQPEIFGLPTSATFSGVGNLPPAPSAVAKPKPKPVKCRKGYTRKKGKCVKRARVKKSTHRKGAANHA